MLKQFDMNILGHDQVPNLNLLSSAIFKEDPPPQEVECFFEGNRHIQHCILLVNQGKGVDSSSTLGQPILSEHFHS